MTVAVSLEGGPEGRGGREEVEESGSGLSAAAELSAELELELVSSWWRSTAEGAGVSAVTNKTGWSSFAQNVASVD